MIDYGQREGVSQRYRGLETDEKFGDELTTLGSAICDVSPQIVST